MAPPFKLTDQMATTILGYIRVGHWIETAALAVGVDTKTLRTWIYNGAKLRTNPPRRPTTRQKQLMAFSKDMDAAVAAAEHLMLSHIATAGGSPAQYTKTVTTSGPDGQTITVTEERRPPDWRAEAWRLERRFPFRWGRQGSLEVTGPDGGPIQTTINAADVLAKLAAARAERLNPSLDLSTADDVDDTGEDTDDLANEQPDSR